MIRVVVDPGVFISALIGPRGGAPDTIVRAFVDERITVIASPLLLDEPQRVLRRPSSMPTATRERPANTCSASAATPRSSTTQPAARTAVRDPNDDYLVALAQHARVDAIGSGDRDLLDAELDAPAVWSPRHAADQITAA